MQLFDSLEGIGAKGIFKWDGYIGIEQINMPISVILRTPQINSIFMRYLFQFIDLPLEFGIISLIFIIDSFFNQYFSTTHF